MNYPELAVFKEFRQVIVWGFPLHTHTHSYIHGAWVKTFQHLGVKVHWFHDKEYPKDFDYTNTCFITEGWADDNIPVNSSSTYFVHIARNPAKYVNIGARLIEIRYNNIEMHEFNYDYKLPEKAIRLSSDTLYEVLYDDSAVALKQGREISKINYETVYMYWATDLLPHEFNYEDAAYIHSKKDIHYISTKNEKFEEFKDEAIRRGFNLIHHNPWIKPLSFEENMILMKESYCAPDFRSNGDPDNWKKYGKFNGNNHLDIGYIPCRVFKAISYGHTGITNSPRVKKILGEYIEYANNPSDVFEIVEKRKNDIEWRKACMKYVSENHTYLQRVRDLARALNIKSKVTVVSAFYNIGRETIDGRSINDYKKYIFNMLKTIKDPFVLYMDSTLNWNEEIYRIRSSIGPIKIIETQLSDIPMWKYRDSVTNIANSDIFKSKLKYPNDLTNLLPEYSLVIYSKFFWIENVFIENPYSSSHCMWIDAGYSRFYKEGMYKIKSNIDNIFFVKVNNKLDLTKYITYDNYICTNECIFHAYLWITDKKSHSLVKSEIMRIWDDEMISKYRFDNEQIALALAYKRIPEQFKTTTGDLFNEIMISI